MKRVSAHTIFLDVQQTEIDRQLTALYVFNHKISRYVERIRELNALNFIFAEQIFKMTGGIPVFALTKHPVEMRSVWTVHVKDIGIVCTSYLQRLKEGVKEASNTVKQLSAYKKEINEVRGFVLREFLDLVRDPNLSTLPVQLAAQSVRDLIPLDYNDCMTVSAVERALAQEQHPPE